jgi:hypothetical protein
LLTPVEGRQVVCSISVVVICIDSGLFASILTAATVVAVAVVVVVIVVPPKRATSKVTPTRGILV